eukprot:4126835-Prymnesium_polylepis.2
MPACDSDSETQTWQRPSPMHSACLNPEKKKAEDEPPAESIQPHRVTNARKRSQVGDLRRPRAVWQNGVNRVVYTHAPNPVA